MKKSKWKIRPTKKQLAVMKASWNLFKEIQDAYYNNIFNLEKKMSKETGIKDLEFIHDSMCMGWAGIGNGERTMKLYQREELEK